MSTYSAKTGEIERQWFVVDAAEHPMGRLATRVAMVLQGKHKPQYTPHIDCGDHVIIVNSDNLSLSGAKMENKTYDRYTGYTSGRRERTVAEQMTLDSTVVVQKAVKGMLPKNRLGRQMLKKLKVYSGMEHPHTAQRPEDLPL